MSSFTRRTFLAGAASVFHPITARKGLGYQPATAKATIQADVPVGQIRPELHGHFAEHLGSCIYGGLWVGKNSPIPNINGHRKQAVEYLRAVGIPVLRWPGGCFADDYHWRDGIGPLEKRPRRVNIWWGMYTEDNSFGTHEFIELCRLIEAEPYIAGNVGSGTPQELRDWMEYCNYPSGSTLSDERIANGAKEPFGVRYWGVGNENWGCGGTMTPEEYAGLYRRFSTYLARRQGSFGGIRPYLIACGPNRNDTDWTKRFLETLGPRGARLTHGYAMHFYSNGRSPATKFTVEHLKEQLSSFAELEKGIGQQHAMLRGFDPEGRIDLLIDEWGVWDQITQEDRERYGALWQQITMRSAVAAAMGLNVFHRQADKLGMGNLAQTVNVLHALLLTEGEHCIRTSTYYAFELMKAHRGRTSLRIESDTQDPLGLSMSASRSGSELVVTLVNPNHDRGMSVECQVTGAGLGRASARMLQHADFNACNTFENPDIIVPKNHPVEATARGIKAELPPLAIVTATVAIS
ncbi:MAG: alpha-N-arabinofuranosidase [Bryobacteraceae bacterium]|nr:alpha-N-arabinofuranosidase [Bryobacteraceae bacterium]